MALIANISPENYAALLAQVTGQQMQVAGSQMNVAAPMTGNSPVPVSQDGLPMVGTVGNVPVLSGHIPPQVGHQLQRFPDGTVGVATNPYAWPLDKYGNIIQGQPYYIRTINTGHIYGR